MSVVNSVVALLFLQTVIILKLSHSVCAGVPPLQCGSEQCTSGSDCRDVVTCLICPVQPQCVPKSAIAFGPGVDLACLLNGFSEAILIEDTNNVDRFNRLGCSGPGEVDCPNGAVCVVAEGGQRICCKGEQQQQQQRRSARAVKPGSCPMFQEQLCSGMACSGDGDCPGDEICCNGCMNVCVKPVYYG